jgi:hypothetical protein
MIFYELLQCSKKFLIILFLRRFETFNEITDEEILQSSIYKKLLNWALGKEATPDLIVIGEETSKK